MLSTLESEAPSQYLFWAIWSSTGFALKVDKSPQKVGIAELLTRDGRALRGSSKLEVPPRAALKCFRSDTRGSMCACILC